MDKIRALMQWLFRNRFWVTCLLVSVASLVTWYMAWNTIKKQRDDAASKLQQKKSSIENVISSEVNTGLEEETLRVHPNDITAKGMEARVKKAAEGALAAWKTRYERQKDLLAYAGVLPQHIRDPLANHEPMEKPLEKELLDDTQRDTFREEIPKHMPDMAARIQSTWRFDALGNKISDADLEADRNDKAKQGGATAIVNDLVIWDEQNQDLWNSKTTEFRGFNGNSDDQNRPTSQQMLALSQDLWILRGIFDAVAEVNKGFTANDLAPIERIDHVLVGAEAVNDDLGTLTDYSYQPPTTESIGGNKKKGGLTSKRQQTRESSKRKRSQASTKASTFDPSASQSPFHGRYVDRGYTRLNEKQITDAITSGQLTEQSYLAVAKRVPVRIAVKMDERRINDFLASLANSPFAFEIRQVRINKHLPGEGVDRKADNSAGKKKEKGGVGLAGGSGGGSGQVDGGPPSGGGKKGKGGDDGRFRSETRTNFDIKIEFIGIVKLYNPVDESLFFPKETEPNEAADPLPN